MHQQRADTGNVCGLYFAQQRILEQRFAKARALVLSVHGKPGQEHDRHGVLRNAFGHTRGCLGWLNAAHGQTVIASNRTSMAAHVSLRAVGFCGLLSKKCIVCKPIVYKSIIINTWTSLFTFKN